MMYRILVILSVVLLVSEAYALDQPSYIFTGKQAAEIVGRSLMKEGTGDALRVQINGVREDDQLAITSALITAETGDLHVDKAHTRWDATLYLSAAGKSLAPVRLSGRYDEMVHLPVLKQRMQSGESISEQDIMWEDVPAPHVRKGVITDAQELLGKSPKRIISADRPIRTDEITGPTLVNKGAQVTLVFKTPAIEIKTLGEAMEGGAKGTVIRVKNLASKAIIQGTVEAEGRVRIGSPDTLAGLM